MGSGRDQQFASRISRFLQEEDFPILCEFLVHLYLDGIGISGTMAVAYGQCDGVSPDLGVYQCWFLFNGLDLDAITCIEVP